MSQRFLGVMVVIGLLSSSACAGGESLSFADFVQKPAGLLSAKVHDLDSHDLEVLLSEVRLRFDSYVELRAALPMGPILDDVSLGVCPGTLLGESVPDQLFVLDVPCHLGGGTGAIGIGQTVMEDGPPAVVRLSLGYTGVQAGALTVDGLEQIDQIEGDSGTSLVTLSLVQDGRAFDYEFRVGLLEDGRQVVDYQLNIEGDLVGVQLSDPSTLGGYLTATVFGIDGSLSCEIRDTEWAPDEPARGTCDNGLVFGL